MAFQAPPSPVGVLVSSGNQLQTGVTQGQTDITTLQNLLNAWPADLPTDLQPVVQILVRVINYEMTLAQGAAAIAQQLNLQL